MPDGDPLLSVRNLVKHYPITEGVLRREVGRVRAVDGISFDLYPGETLGLVGESGCGKSTAALSILRLEEPTAGEVRFAREAGRDGDGSDADDRDAGGRSLDDRDAGERAAANRATESREGRPVESRGDEAVTDYDRAGLKRFRRRAQMIFQDPTSSFDPRMTVGESVAEPLLVHGMRDRKRRRGIVENLLERVDLSAEDYDRYPHEFSGGQKQRVAIARALVVNPDLVVADEPVSALDVSVQAEILRLLEDVQAEFGLSMLFISHDMGVVREVCDRVAVMYLGEIVELARTDELFEAPQHPYTRALLASMPAPDPRKRGRGIELSGDVPSPSDPPPGCRFHTRCPEVIQPEGYDFEQENWRAVMDLRVRLERGNVDLDGIREFATAETDAEDPEAVDDDRLRWAVREQFDVPETLADPSADRVLREAVDAIVAGESEEARALLAEEFETVCETEHPELMATNAGHPAACHLHDETLASTPPLSRSTEN